MVTGQIDQRAWESLIKKYKLTFYEKIMSSFFKRIKGKDNHQPEETINLASILVPECSEELLIYFLAVSNVNCTTTVKTRIGLKKQLVRKCTKQDGKYVIPIILFSTKGSTGIVNKFFPIPYDLARNNESSVYELTKIQGHLANSQANFIQIENYLSKRNSDAEICRLLENVATAGYRNTMLDVLETFTKSNSPKLLRANNDIIEFLYNYDSSLFDNKIEFKFNICKNSEIPLEKTIVYNFDNSNFQNNLTYTVNSSKDNPSVSVISSAMAVSDTDSESDNQKESVLTIAQQDSDDVVEKEADKPRTSDKISLSNSVPFESREQKGFSGSVEPIQNMSNQQLPNANEISELLKTNFGAAQYAKVNEILKAKPKNKTVGNSGNDSNDIEPISQPHNTIEMIGSFTPKPKNTPKNVQFDRQDQYRTISAHESSNTQRDSDLGRNLDFNSILKTDYNQDGVTKPFKGQALNFETPKANSTPFQPPRQDLSNPGIADNAKKELIGCEVHQCSLDGNGHCTDCVKANMQWANQNHETMVSNHQSASSSVHTFQGQDSYSKLPSPDISKEVGTIGVNDNERQNFLSQLDSLKKQIQKLESGSLANRESASNSPSVNNSKSSKTASNTNRTSPNSRASNSRTSSKKGNKRNSSDSSDSSESNNNYRRGVEGNNENGRNESESDNDFDSQRYNSIARSLSKARKGYKLKSFYKYPPLTKDCGLDPSAYFDRFLTSMEINLEKGEISDVPLVIVIHLLSEQMVENFKPQRELFKSKSKKAVNLSELKQAFVKALSESSLLREKRFEDIKKKPSDITWGEFASNVYQIFLSAFPKEPDPLRSRMLIQKFKSTMDKDLRRDFELVSMSTNGIDTIFEAAEMADRLCSFSALNQENTKSIFNINRAVSLNPSGRERIEKGESHRVKFQEPKDNRSSNPNSKPIRDQQTYDFNSKPFGYPATYSKFNKFNNQDSYNYSNNANNNFSPSRPRPPGMNRNQAGQNDQRLQSNFSRNENRRSGYYDSSNYNNRRRYENNFSNYNNRLHQQRPTYGRNFGPSRFESRYSERNNNNRDLDQRNIESNRNFRSGGGRERPINNKYRY